MIYTFVDSPLWYLQWLEKEYGWEGEAPVDESGWEGEAPVLTLKLELRFLRTYLVYLSMAKVNPSGSGFSPLINGVAAAFRDLTKDLSSACRGSPSEVGPVVSSMLEKVKGCKGEIKEAYTVLWDQAWKSNTSLNGLSVMEFIDSIQVNLRDLLSWKNLVSDMKINIESLGEKLSYIADFIGITYQQNVTQQKMGPDLTNVKVFAASAACLSYFCWFDEMDGTLPGKISRWFDEMDDTLPKIMSPVMQEISRKKLQSTDGSVIVTVNEGAAAGLEFQKTFSDDPPEEKKKDHRMISLTYSVHGNKLTEYLTMKVNEALLPLLKKVEVIRVDMYAKKQQKHRADLLYPLKDQIKSLQEDIKSIESDFKTGKLFSARTEDVARESSFLVSSLHLNDMASHRFTEVNTSLPEIIDVIKAELLLLLLRNDEASLNLHMNDQAEKLQGGLEIIRSFLMNPPRKYSERKELMLLKKSESVAIETASIILSFYENVMKGHMTKELDLMISKVLEKIVLLKVEIRKVHLHVPLSLHSNIPDGMVFLSSMLGDIKETLEYKAHSIDFVKPQIEMLQAELESLKSFLTDIEQLHNEHEELNDLWTCITDVAYEAEYMIDSSVFGDDAEWCFMLWLPFAMEKIKFINSRKQEIYENGINDSGVGNLKNSMGHQLSRVDIQEVAAYVVGLYEEADFIIDLLKSESKHLDIVSIVGPSGLGKTTLAKELYISPTVAYHFHVQVWCTLSQEYQRRELFLDILRGIHEVSDGSEDMTVDDLASEVYKRLKKRRYLIVIDNMQHAQAWEDLRRILPDDNTGSRVLLTSQLPLVAFHANPYSEPYVLRLLSAEESWTLLKMKIFPAEDCPTELLKIGQEVSVKCKGLPIALVLMAGLLARTDMTPNSWKLIAKSFRSDILVDSLEDICELCYKHLPDRLKSCFLYFGAFPMNKEISVPKLLRLWIAEGFSQKTDSRSMEDTAHEYLEDLIGRNLVIISQRSSSHGIKTCRVNDLFWNLCIRKAKEENFLQLSYWSYLSNPLAFEHRRLCLSIDAEENQFTVSSPSTPFVRSLLCTVSCDEDPELPQHASFISRNLKLLRVLDLESVNMGNSFPDGLQLLELLRYLAVRGSIKSVPPSLANLWNLETLIVKGSRDPVALPNSIWSMQKLRHVHILPHFTFDLQDDEFVNSDVQLENLFSLSTLVIVNGNPMENAIRRFPRLRRLKCILVPSWDSIRKCYRFPVLDFLSQLESLNMSPTEGNYYPCEFSFPFNLKKLTLSNFGLPWSEISKIGKLPNLEILKLASRTFEGREWEGGEAEFRRLKYLKLDSLDIALWKPSSGSFPILERLVIQRCGQLEEIPSRLGYISSLQTIEVQSCSSSAVDSARRFLNKSQHIKVVINARMNN